MSERFLWDLRKTVSELMVENYVAEFRRLAHANGLRFTFESYTTTGNDLDAANFADKPMAEFWTPSGQGADFYPTKKSMASSAHLDGRTIVGAEAFTSFRTERWRWRFQDFSITGNETTRAVPIPSGTSPCKTGCSRPPADATDFWSFLLRKR